MKNNNHNKTRNTFIQSLEPVFIHSLWRAGSTYLFSVFRRSPLDYCCYQEPIHELALYCKDAPDNLNSDAIVSPDVLRHPPLGKPYFHELFNIWPKWRDDIHKQIIYDTYFGEAANENTIRYLSKIIRHSKGRPVIQECRTAGRINILKKALGGFHIYLWRDPWDQWWSYKSTYYFDTTSQLILNTTVHPDAITRLRQEIGFTEFHHEDLAVEISFFNDNRLSAEHSYLAFYLLWCLGLLEGSVNADYMLNIDMLSDSEINRDAALKHLNEFGVSGIDFSDCKVPQTYYSHSETRFFIELEERIHGILLLSGYNQIQINELQELRKTNAPRISTLPISAIPNEILLSQAALSRNIVIRHESEHVSRLKQKNNQLFDLNKREIELSRQLATERENIRRLQDITTQQSEESIHTNQILEDVLNRTTRQQFEYAQREQELTLHLQNSQQILIKLQDTLLQREQHINELQEKFQNAIQDEQNKLFNAVKLSHEMQRHIDQLNTEVNGYRKEILTYHESAMRSQSYLSNLVSEIDQINTSSDFISMNSDTTPKSLCDGAPTHATFNLNELLQLHDKQFVTCAYQTLLGRLPDQEGFQYYLERLRSGISKYEILAQMRFSKEGKVC